MKKNKNKLFNLFNLTVYIIYLAINYFNLFKYNHGK